MKKNITNKRIRLPKIIIEPDRNSCGACTKKLAYGYEVRIMALSVWDFFCYSCLEKIFILVFKCKRSKNDSNKTKVGTGQTETTIDA